MEFSYTNANLPSLSTTYTTGCVLLSVKCTPPTYISIKKNGASNAVRQLFPHFFSCTFTSCLFLSSCSEQFLHMYCCWLLKGLTRRCLLFPGDLKEDIGKKKKKKDFAQHKSDTQRLPMFLGEEGLGGLDIHWKFMMVFYRRSQTKGPRGDRERQRELPLTSSLWLTLTKTISSPLSLRSLYPPPSPLPPCLIPHLAGHFHGLGDRSHSLSTVGVGADARAGPIHGAGTCQGGCSRASQSSHTGRRHWEAENGSVTFAIRKK